MNIYATKQTYKILTLFLMTKRNFPMNMNSHKIYSGCTSQLWMMDDLTEKLVHVINNTDERLLAADNPQAKLLWWHYWLRHISFAMLHILALLVGAIPRKLIHMKTPKCAGCMYRAMTKCPWRTKTQEDKSKIKSVTKPGDCISVDQMELLTPGFVAQLKGALTKKWYQAAMVFVDHTSWLSYIHLQQGLTSAEMVKAKQAFKAYTRSHGVSIKHYHADNGRFADNAFINLVARSGQTISYCGVNAHFQNGIAEKWIRDLEEQARKQLLHTKSCWPSAIEINLWPYALQTVNDLCNMIPDKEDGSSPLERFCRTNISPRLWHNHTFRCPVYELDNQLTSKQQDTKMEPKSMIGYKPQIISKTCKLCYTGIEFGNRVSITTVPHALWWFLQDNMTISRKWMYLFTMAVHSRSQAASIMEPIHTFQGSQHINWFGSVDTTKSTTTRQLWPMRQLITTWARFTRTRWHCNGYASISRMTYGMVYTIVRTLAQCQSIQSHLQAYKMDARKFRTMKHCISSILWSNAWRWLHTSKRIDESNCIRITCQQRYHVLSWGNASTRCWWICQSCSKGSERSHWMQALGIFTMQTSTQGREDITGSMVHETQVRHKTQKVNKYKHK